GTTGLVHISEVADVYVKDIKDFVQLNDQVKVKILSMQNGKIGLSIRQAQPKPSRQNLQSFEDKLAKFMKDSDERQSDLKKSQDSKRGGRGGGRLSHF
ncbi:MAG TPA: RNA-binding protein S1, partial [Firmicutes bacterium]|nr:RNA-binding protein S1 [Bacillota bacterium]